VFRGVGFVDRFDRFDRRALRVSHQQRADGAGVDTEACADSTVVAPLVRRDERRRVHHAFVLSKGVFRMNDVVLAGSSYLRFAAVMA
jgi:hypothetical protein